VTQWFLRQAVKLAQHGQGIGRVRADKAALHRLGRVNRPAVIFDVGANSGEYTQLALRRLSGHQAFIHAFEPSAAAFEQLRRRFAERSGIALNNFALGSEHTQQTLYYDIAGSELSSLYPRKIGHHGIAFTGSEQVPVETLDRYCESQNVSRIDLLKLDAEGHELPILQGAVQMFEREAINMVSFEFGGCNIDSRTFVRDFFDFFARYRMKLTRVTAFGNLYEVKRYEESLEQFRTTCFVALRN
jgi:FkbM family methyltransferase